SPSPPRRWPGAWHDFPRVRHALFVFALVFELALGDLSLLDVDVLRGCSGRGVTRGLDLYNHRSSPLVTPLPEQPLSVRAHFLSDDLIRAANRLGREVHVWTVNDAAVMRRFIMRGVDNIITSDPELAIRVRNEWAASTESQRLLLSSQVLLGIEP